MSVLVNGQPLPCSPWNVSVRPHKYTSSFNFASLRKGRKFKEPCALAINNETKRIAIADRKKQRVRLFDFNDSQYLKELGEKGSAARKLSDPTSVAFNNYGEVIVISSGTMCYFSTDGESIKCIDNNLNRL